MKEILICMSIFFTGCSHLLKTEYERLLANVALRPIPLTENYWNLQYTGGGVVMFSDSSEYGGLVMAPQTPSQESETYAALVVSNENFVKSLKDFVFEVEVVNQQQLRELSPNPWEVFWFFFNYRIGGDGKKEANYFVPKFEKGMELGKAYGEVGQTFLKTSATPHTELTTPEKYTFIKKGQTLKVFKNKRPVFAFKGHEDVLMYDHVGQFGLYTEDAIVKVLSVSYGEL